MFQELDLFSSSDEGKETPTLTSITFLSKGPNRLGVSLPSPDGGNRSSYRDAFSSHSEFRTTDKVHEPRDTESMNCPATLVLLHESQPGVLW
jgi:hypothetical protein